MSPTLLLAASAFAADRVDFTCTPDPGGGILGLPPLEVECVLVPPDEGTWEEVTWSFGETGELFTGDSASYTYDEPGQYSISALLEGYEGTNDPYEQKYGFATICGEPEARFTYTNKGGLDYELVNKTVVAVGCLDQILWEVFRGEQAQGEPRFAFDNWSPRFELPEEGPWTVRLTVAGMAGTTAADLTIDARYQLTDDFTQGPRAYWCSTAPSTSGVALVLVGALLLRRRRR